MESFHKEMPIENFKTQITPSEMFAHVILIKLICFCCFGNDTSCMIIRAGFTGSPICNEAPLQS